MAQPARHRDPEKASSPAMPAPSPTDGRGSSTAELPGAIPQTGRASTLRPAVWVILALLLVLAIVGWYWLTAGRPARVYKTSAVDRGPIISVVTATGTVNPVISVEVGSQVSGKIAELYADFNATVTEGQVIALIDQMPYQARVRQARARLKSARGSRAQAEAMLSQRRLEFNRMSELRRQQFVSQADVDLARTAYRDAEARLEVAKAEVDQATAALAAAELDLGFTTIRSPVTGTVVSRNVEEGQTVVASFQTPVLFVIAQDLARMQVIANVSESDIGGLQEGTPAEFRVDAYRREAFRGVVTQVRNAPVSIQNVVTYDVVIAVDNTELKLKPGMTANVTLVTGRSEDALRVPNAALRFRMPDVPYDRTTSRVWVVDAEASPRAVPVTMGLADTLYTEITGEIREGDAVIVGFAETDQAGEESLPPGFQMGPRIR